jgi:hypothetical protein
VQLKTGFPAGSKYTMNAMNGQSLWTAP